MAIEVSQLTTVVQRAREIMSLAVRYPGSVFDIATGHPGYNSGPLRYRFFDMDIDLTTCCTDNDNTGNFSQKDFELECITSQLRFCAENLIPSFNDFVWRVTAGAEELPRPLVDIFTQTFVDKFGNTIDNLAVLGNTTNGDLINGYVTQALANTDSVVTPNASNLDEAIIQLINALPPEARNMGQIGIFMPPEWASFYQRYLVDRNLYHYPPGTVSNEYDTLMVPGYSGYTIYPLSALAGTNYIFATPINNMHWFTNMTNDKNTLAWERCNCDRDWLLYMQIILGVGFLVDDWVKIMTLPTDIALTPICINICTTEAEGASIVIPASASVDVKDLTPEQIAEALAAKGVNVPASLTKMIE